MDVCCSYGINAALLKHELTLNDLYARYGSGELAGLSSEELTALAHASITASFAPPERKAELARQLATTAGTDRDRG